MKILATELNLVGLSANQVGIPSPFFIAKVEAQGDFITFINPKIKPIKENGRKFGWEGCASIPGKLCLVERWVWVRIEYTDIHGENVFMLLTGLSARTVQHENDHLNGVLITSKARETRKVVN